MREPSTPSRVLMKLVSWRRQRSAQQDVMLRKCPPGPTTAADRGRKQVNDQMVVSERAVQLEQRRRSSIPSHRHRIPVDTVRGCRDSVAPSNRAADPRGLFQSQHPCPHARSFCRNGRTEATASGLRIDRQSAVAFIGERHGDPGGTYRYE
jgi:hypothetical protein